MAMPNTIAQKFVLPKSPVEEFVEKISPLKGLPDVEVLFHHVIVAKYIREKLGNGSLLAAQQTKLEDKYQSKIGVVLKVGPAAFQNDRDFDFRGITVDPGEWVMFRMSDGWDFDYTPPGATEAIHMKMLEDSNLRCRVGNPERIY